MTTVEAFRTGPELVGAFHLRIRSRNEVLVETEALVDSDLAVRNSTLGNAEQRRRWQLFIRTLANLHLTFFFLTADRRSDEPQDEEDEGTLEGLESGPTFRRLVRRRQDAQGVDERLAETVARLEKWIRDEALKGTNIGEAGTHSVYADIAKRIAQTRRPGRRGKVAADQLVASLQMLESRSRPFSSLGLISAPQLTEVIKPLETAPPTRRELIANVVAPYVESLEARLNALEEIQVLVNLFLRRINSFFRNKTVSYDLARGLAIRTSQGDALQPSQLSSGERQLLALLAQVVVSRKSTSIFLIDEPEISLNVKWQRALVDTLLELVRGTGVQFILATHSLELLASHGDHVHRLGANADRDGGSS